MHSQVLYDNLVPLDEETLAASSLEIRPVVLMKSGETLELPSLLVPTAEEEAVSHEYEDYNNIPDADDDDDGSVLHWLIAR